jgi:hypothetical protein
VLRNFYEVYCTSPKCPIVCLGSYHVDPSRIVMARTERSIDNMIGQFGDKWFMIFWYAELVGWMVRGKKSIE